MKKYLLCAMMCVMTITSLVAQPRTSERKMWKTAKKQTREYVADGWKTDGLKPMSEYIFDTYLKLQDQNNQEIVGTVQGATSAKTLNQAKQWAYTSAIVEYGKQAKMMLRGRLTEEFGAGLADSPSMDNFYEAYEALVVKEINGQIKKIFGIYRTKDDGTIDYRAYCLVNEETAAESRIRAYERLKEEYDFIRDNAEIVADFVRKGFEIDSF